MDTLYYLNFGQVKVRILGVRYSDRNYISTLLKKFQEETNIRLLQERETAIAECPPSGAITPTTPGDYLIIIFVDFKLVY